jgi:hypothetical protein
LVPSLLKKNPYKLQYSKGVDPALVGADFREDFDWKELRTITKRQVHMCEERLSVFERYL